MMLVQIAQQGKMKHDLFKIEDLYEYIVIGNTRTGVSTIYWVEDGNYAKLANVVMSKQVRLLL
jgi:hypothetical protein